MPALPDVSQVVRITMQFKLAADLDVVNRFYQKYGGTPGALTVADADSWAGTVGSAWSTHLAPHQRTELQLEEVTLEDLTSDTGAVGTAAFSGTGSESTSALTAGTALIIKQHIERRYRGGHPRQYLAGIDGSHLSTDQTWDGGFLATFVAAYIAFRAECASGCPSGLAPATDVSVSYYQGFHNVTFPSERVRSVPTRRSTPVVDPISTFTANPKVGSQRRRNLQSL